MNTKIPRNIRCSLSRIGIVGAIASALGTFGAFADPDPTVDYSWNSATNPGLWSLNTNWTGSPAAGGPSGAGIYVKIGRGISSSGTVTLFNTGDSGSATKTVGRLDIGDTNNSDHYFIVAGTGGGVLNFDGNGGNAQLNELTTSHGDTITAAITLSTSLDITNSSSDGGLLTLSSVSSAAGANTITIKAGSVSSTGGIKDGSGVMAVNVSGGSLTLGGSSNYTGGTTVTAGTVSIHAYSPSVSGGALTGGALGAGTVQMGSGTNTVVLRTDLQSAVTVDNSFVFNGDVTFGLAGSGNGTAAISINTQAVTGNSITLTRTNQFTTRVTTTMTGPIVDGGNNYGFIKSGTGTLNFGNGESAANTYTGLTTVNEGNMVLNKAANTNAIAGDLLISGSGTVTLSGSNNENINNSSTVTVNTGGTFATNGRTETIGNLAVGGGVVSGAGSLIVGGAGTTMVSSGSVAVSNLTTGSGGITLGSGASVSSAVNLNGDVTFNGSTTGATLGSGAVSLNGNRTFTVSSGTSGSDLVVSGAIGNGSVTGSGITKDGAGALVLNASNTYTGATSLVNGTLVVNGSLANTAVTVGDGLAGTRTPTLSGTGSIAGLVTTQNNGSNAAHLAPGTNITGNFGATGTLTLSNGLTIGAGTNLDYDLAGSSSGDVIRVSGGTLTLNSGITLNIADAGSLGDGTFTIFDYNGATLSGFNASDFSIGSTPLAGKSYTFADTGSTITLTIANASGNGPTTYTLTATIGNTNVLAGKTTNITSVITNTGTGNADTLNYNGLTASTSGGTINGTSVNGGPLAQGASGTNSGITFTAGATSGTYAINAVVTSATNATIGGDATVSGTTPVTVHVYDEAALSAQQSGTNFLAMNAAGTDRASAKVTSDNGLSNNQGFNNVTVATGTQIDPGSNVNVATFDKSGKLNGTYTAQKNLGFDNVTGSGDPIAGGNGDNGSIVLTVTVTGQTAGAGQLFTAPVFSGQKYGTTIAGGSSSGYGLTSNIGGDLHAPTTATLIGGTASADTTVGMSFNTVPSAGAGHDNAFRTSDILTLTGIVATGAMGHDGSILTDKFVLQLTYDPAASGPQYIGWYDATLGQWVNAVSGNSTPGTYFGNGEFVGSYADYLASLDPSERDNLQFQLGAFGFDSSTDTTWAVLDHNSEFAVIPEPQTWSMLLCGIGFLAGWRKFRRRVG